MSLGLLLGAQDAAKPPSPVPARQEEKVQVNFMGMELETIAQQVERVTKKSFLFQEQALRGKKVTLKSDTPISPDEFYRVFQTVCLMHGLMLVPVKGENINLVKIVQTQQAQKEPGMHPILTRGDPLPAGDTLIYYLLAPQHISSTRAMTVLSSALSSTAVLQQVAGSELILVVDVASAIGRAEKLLSLIDLPSERVVTSTVTLQHLSVSQAKAQLSDYTQAQEKASTGETGKSKLVVLLDDRLNTLDLIGPEPEVKHAEEYLKRIDRELPPARRTIQYYKLKNVPASDIADTVRQLLGLAVAAREAEAGATGGAPNPHGNRPPSPLTGQPVPPQPFVTAPAPGAPETLKTEAPRPPQPPPRAASALTSGALGPRTDLDVLALEGQNMLVVIGTQTVHDEVKRILESLDRRKGQVLIEVAILQVTGDDSLDFGIEALQEDRKGDGAIVSGGIAHGLGTQANPSGSGFPTVQNLTGFTGGALRYLKPDDISVLVRALATKSKVNILSQPLLLVNDNESADFTTKVSEPTVAISQGTASTVTSFAGFAEAATSLKIMPQISPEGYINLKITQNFEEFNGQAASGIPPPKVSNSVTTIITVPDRYTAILGGFMRDAATESRSGIPILMDVPIVGALASRTTSKITKSRLYLFVRPRILTVDGFADLKKASQEKVKDVRRFTHGSDIELEVGDAIFPPPGPDVKEVPLPFGEEEPRK
jgi:general secretion pathway protein D